MQHRVLVVDDDAMNREIIAELLTESHCVAFAESGLEALETAREFSPDLVLLDIMMPGIDGYETCQRLREEYPFTKIILVSAKATASERRRGYEVGADDYVTKPFDPLEFQAKIGVFLRLGFVEEIARTKSDLLVLLAHETRTPLSHIISCAELLEAPDVGAVTGDLPTIILEGARRLAEIFEKSMTLFTIESDRGKTPETPISIAEILHTEITALDAGVQSSIHLTIPDGTWVPGDEASLRQAFRALIDFFVTRKAGAAGTLHIECVAESPEHGSCHLRFSDDGEDIATDTMSHLFELLSVEDVDHHSSSDLNFDLPICAAILRRHGGTVRAARREGGGLLFDIVLPRAGDSGRRVEDNAA